MRTLSSMSVKHANTVTHTYTILLKKIILKQTINLFIVTWIRIIIPIKYRYDFVSKISNTKYAFQTSGCSSQDNVWQISNDIV